MRQFWLSGCIALAALVAVVALQRPASADSLKRLPAFELKTLDERDVRLTDDKFKDKRLLVAAFSTWQDVSRRQAAELEKFHKAHPDVEIIAIVVQSLSESRDFKQEQGLSYECYKCDGVSNLSTNLNRLFPARKNRVVNLNRVPFVILTDKQRGVVYANIGLTDEARLSAELAKNGG